MNMENTAAEKYYRERLSAIQTELETSGNRYRFMPWIRFILFISIIVAGYAFLIHTSNVTYAVVSAVSVVFFIIFYTQSNKLKNKIRLLEFKNTILNAELKALNGDFSFFDDGKEFTDTKHDYSFDLDIFGKHSIFQMLNRTSTKEGKNRLAYELQHAYELSGDWKNRQEAINELSKKTEFRENFQSAFFDVSDNEPDDTTFRKWLNNKKTPFNLLIIILSYVLPVVNICCIILSIIDVIRFPVLLPLILLAITAYFGKTTMREMQQAGHSSKILSSYADLLENIEKENFKSDYILDIQKNKLSSGNNTASGAIKQLAKLVNYLDSNLNILVSVLLNGIFLFNIHLILRIQKWKLQNSKNAGDWFDAIAITDSLCSFANYRFNNPGFAFPQIYENENFELNAENMGHPLIDEGKRISNSFKISGWSSYIVITGANMAGKSTFLRTIGVNQVLAMLGSVVCADKMTSTPAPLYTSLRTSDSLAENESYFYAELRRLQWIIDNVRANKAPLILLDEILKGTNSADKQAGSIALLKELLQFKAVGVIATHDVALGKLEEVYPGQVLNYCFEIQINGNEMKIDYKLQPGISKNLNATFLMVNMGILKPN